MKYLINDLVMVTTGKDKGKKGKITKIFPKTNSVLVEGLSGVVKHRKPMMGRSGERVMVAKPVNISKIAILNASGEVDRIGYQVAKDGKYRVLRKSGEKLQAGGAVVTKDIKTKIDRSKEKSKKTKK